MRASPADYKSALHLSGAPDILCQFTHPQRTHQATPTDHLAAPIRARRESPASPPQERILSSKARICGPKIVQLRKSAIFTVLYQQLKNG